MHFDLVRRGIILLKFQFHFCQEFGSCLYEICYSGAENICLSSHFGGRTDTSCLLSAARFIFVSSSLYAPRLPALSHFVSVVELFYCVQIVTIKVLESRIYPPFLCLLCFSTQFFPFSVSSEFKTVLMLAECVLGYFGACD